MSIRVGDLVKITDPRVCRGGASYNMHDTYVVVECDQRGCDIEDVQTGKYCGYLFNYRFKKIHHKVTCTRRLTVLREDERITDE